MPSTRLQGGIHRVSGFGFWVSVLVFGFRVPGSGFEISGFALRASCFVFRVSCSWFQVSDSGLRAPGFQVQAPDLGCRVLGSQDRVLDGPASVRNGSKGKNQLDCARVSGNRAQVVEQRDIVRVERDREVVQVASPLVQEGGFRRCCLFFVYQVYSVTYDSG